jgi:hypothetical protein
MMVGFLEQNMNTKVNLEACLTRKQGVCHTCGLAIYNKKKSILRQKGDLWKIKYFSMQKYNLQNIL